MLRFIVNPVAQSGAGKRIWENIEDELNNRNIGFEVYYTEGKGDMRRIAGELQEKSESDPIISVGGDGSLGDILNGVDLSKKPILGLVPAGSGNDFNRGMGYKRNPLLCIERIIACKEYRTLDAGLSTFDVVLPDGSLEHHERRFCVSSGFGYDAETCVHLNNSKVKVVFNKLGLGKLSYFAIGFKTFFVFRQSRATLYFDDEAGVKTRPLDFLSAHSLPFEGGGYPFARLASNTDGELTTCVVGTKNRFAFFWAFLLSKSFKDFHTRFSGVYNKNCKKLRVELERPLPIHCDGEEFDNATNITFEVLPEAFRYIG